MAIYMMQSSYTAEAWAGLLSNPEDRMKVIGPIVEGLGGRMVGAWFTFGEYDVVGIAEMPDNVTAAALAMAISSTGMTKAVKTTPLMTIEEGIEAMKKAATAMAGYRPPGG